MTQPNPQGEKMHQRNWLRALALAPCLTWMLAAQDAAPSGPVKIEPHRSRWDYPKEVTVPAKHKLHIVQTGDTLWDLASKELGNPFSWPQIWELNQWIKDPHWIYPGDPLLIDLSRVAVAKGEDKGDGDISDPAVRNLGPDRRTAIAQREELAYSFSDFIQMPFIAPQGAQAFYKEQGALRIAGAKNDNRHLLADGEVIYLAGGADRGVKAGDRLVVMKTVQTRFFHPDDQRRKTPLGDIVQHVGTVRVTTVNPKSSIAVIEKSMNSIAVGDHVASFTEPANMPAKLRTDVADPLEAKNPAKVIFAKDSRGQVALGELILVDRGRADGLNVGDVLLGVRTRSFPLTEAKVAKNVVMDQTGHYMGQVVVIRADEHSATCRILRSVQEFQVGDVVSK